MDFSQKKSINKFYDEFSERVGDKVISLEMVQLSSTPAVLSELNLKANPLTKELWGLLVFCSKSIYFYVHPYESAIASMMRQASHAEAPQEQILELTSLKSIRFGQYQKKWYEIFSAISKFYLEFEDKNNTKKIIDFATQNKVNLIMNKISEVFENRGNEIA